MKWEDFGPFVLPYVVGCPLPTMVHHVRLAAIEFCKRTKCWARNLEPVTAFDPHIVEIEPDSTNARILAIEWVTVDGAKVPVLSADTGLAKSLQPSSEKFSFSEDLASLCIYPAMTNGAQVVARVAMVPKLTANELPVELEEYAQHIANGAIASIMRIPGQPFTGPSGDFEALFRAEIRTESARLARGQMANGDTRQVPSFL